MSGVEADLHRFLAQRSDAGLPGQAELAALVRSVDPVRPPGAVAASVSEVLARVHGLGLLEPLLADPSVTDILVNGPGPVWVERDGQLLQTTVELDRASLDLLVERIVAPLGRRADPVHPTVDGRLPDGSRVHVVVPPVAVDGPCIAIRRFSARSIPLQEMSTEAVADHLRRAVGERRNIVISGATGSGKTTLLNALAAHVPHGERIITIEDAAELRLPTAHVVRLEAQATSGELTPAVPIRALVRHALRMRPDRIVVGEVRGAEAFDLLSAMSTGHDGSLSTVHANSAVDAMARLEGLVLLAGVGLPLSAVRRQLAAAVDLVVHVARRPGGARRVVEVLEPRPSRHGGGGGSEAESPAVVARRRALAQEDAA